MIWAVIGSAYYVYGDYLYRFFALRTEKKDGFFAKIWLGWGFSIAFFCLWHFFFPINWLGSFLFYVPAFIAFIICFRKELFELIRQENAVVLCVAVIAILVGIWVAVQDYMCPDTGFYHLNTIRWFNEYAIVPGLGNIHTRLGFNQLNYINCASINFYPFLKHPGNHAGTTFLMVLLILNCSFVRRGVDCLILYLFGLIPISRNWLSSPTADWVTAFLQIASFRYFYIAIDKNFSEEKEYSYVSITAILAALSVVVKLNSAFFALGLGIITLFLALKNKLNDDSARQLKKVFIYIGILTCLWIARGYILTGCPLFPSTIGKINFEWAVDNKYAKLAEDSVYVFARLNDYDFNNESLKDYGWIKNWWVRNFDLPLKYYTRRITKNNLTNVSLFIYNLLPGGWGCFWVSFVVSGGFVTLLLVMGMINCLIKKSFAPNSPLVFIVLLSIMCVVICLVLAPAERFLAGIPVVLCASCVLFWKKSFDLKISLNSIRYLMGVLPIILVLSNNPLVKSDKLHGIYILEANSSTEMLTDSGLKCRVFLDLKWPYDYYLVSMLANEYNPKLRMLGETYQDGFAGR